MVVAIAWKTHGQATRVCEILRSRCDVAAQCLKGQLEIFLPRVERALTQAARRTLQDEPAGQKILSLFEPHRPP